MPGPMLPGRGRPGRGQKKETPFQRFGQAQAVFTAKLLDVRWGPVAHSMPPIYSMTLTLEIGQVFRGPFEPKAKVSLNYSARQMQRPNLPLNETFIVTTKGAAQTISSIELSTPELVKTARLATALPLGWSMKEDKATSPWAALGKKAWPAGAKVGEAKLTCSATGRPALFAGAGITLSVAPVPPAKKIKWTNPDGDGQFTLTVTNTTQEKKTVPALLTDGKGILWNECLAVICQGKTQPLPAAKGIASPPTPAVLEPGQSVSTVVNALTLKGLRWPRGGYRINFQLCLGELSATQSMYYMSRHHDKLRKAANKGK